MLSPVQILSLEEIALVVSGLRRRSKHSKSAPLSLILFRLSACCGLRVAEIAGLSLADVKVSCARPHIHVPASIGKGHKSRIVPLWWDAGTLADIELWKANRMEDGATGSDPFLCSTRSHRTGARLGRRTLQQRWERTIRVVLGNERADMLSIHDGRHSFCSNALNAGKTLVQVRDAAGHSSVATTNIYLHLAPETAEIGNAFAVA